MKVIYMGILFVLLSSYYSFAQPYDCDYKVEILINGTESNIGGFMWRIMATKLFGNSTNITGTVEIKDSNGKILKSYRPWINQSISKQKTSNEYLPKLKENEEYRIISRINVECNDTNKYNNVDIKSFKIGKIEDGEYEDTIQLTTKNDQKKINETIYESSNEKARNLILIFLLALSILLNIILIWRR